MIEFQKRIDELLGYVPMYKLVVICLSAIATMSLLLMISGHLSYSPIAFAGSLVFAVFVAYAGNRLFGWLFGVRPHIESAIITGLILALLFSPPETAIAWVKFGIVITIAMASKYVLNVRGKHIFNPAAIAIVIASVSGLAYASWWIATPALLPITALVSLIILYKTQKLQMAGVFMVAALIMITLQSALIGNLNIQALSVAFTSWPLVFFAGIMLSEPLTLPPRHKQQLLYAGAVGLLMAIPFQYASVTMTPALALVLGNIYAFYAGVRQAVKLRFVTKKQEARNIYEFIFDAPKISYEAGQYIELSLPHSKADFRGSRRVFTIIGQPQEELMSIATRFPEKHSTYKDSLLSLKAGDIVYGTRVAGDFVLPSDKNVPIVCIAGGIGITPFVSFAMNGAGRDITILYVVSTISDLAFAHELSRYDVQVVVISPESSTLPVKEWHYEKGPLNAHTIDRYVTSESHVYISGSPSMVTTTKRLVKDNSKAVIHTDNFSGY